MVSTTYRVPFAKNKRHPKRPNGTPPFLRLWTPRNRHISPLTVTTRHLYTGPMSSESTFEALLESHQQLYKQLNEVRNAEYYATVERITQALRDWRLQRSTRVKGGVPTPILLEVTKAVSDAETQCKESMVAVDAEAGIHRFTGAEFTAAIQSAKQEAVEEYKESHKDQEFTDPRMVAAVEVCNRWEHLCQTYTGSSFPVFWDYLSLVIRKLNKALGRPDPPLPQSPQTGTTASIENDTPAKTAKTKIDCEPYTIIDMVDLDRLSAIRDAAIAVCRSWEKQVAGAPRDYFTGMGDALAPMVALFTALDLPLPIQLRNPA